MEIRVNKVVRVAAGEDAAAWRDALATPGWADAATVLKEDRGSWVRRANLLGRDVVVKCRELNTIGRRFKHTIGMGHGAKHWRGAAALKKAGIRTGRPLALARANLDGDLCELLVLEFVPGRTLLSVLDDITRGTGPSVRAQHKLARAAGEMIPTLGRAGWSNRDHKPSNLIVMETRADAYEIAVIDCVGLCWRWPLDDDGYLEMLASLMIEPIGCDCAARRGLWAKAVLSMGWLDNRDGRVRLRDLREEVVEQVQKIVKHHGDPRPRVNPLTENQ